MVRKLYHCITPDSFTECKLFRVWDDVVYKPWYHHQYGCVFPGSLKCTEMVPFFAKSFKWVVVAMLKQSRVLTSKVQ